MSKVHMSIPEITPDTKNWTATVLVKYKYVARQSQRSSLKYQKLIMIDRDETEVQVVIYGLDISRMSHKIQMQETYLVSNARVLFTDPKFRMVDNNYHWVIDMKTIVLKVPTDALPRDLGAPNFVPFSDIPGHLNTRTYIDILGIIIDRLEPRTLSGKYGASTLQDFVIVNQEMNPTVISLWNDVLTTEGAAIFDTTEEMPIIAATRLDFFVGKRLLWYYSEPIIPTDSRSSDLALK